MVGCDPSSAKLTFYAIHLPTGTVKTHVANIGKGKWTPGNCERAMYVAWEAIEMFDPMRRDGTAAWFYIEEPVVGRGGFRSTMVQSFVSGPVQACFSQANYNIELVNNSTWKAWLGVAGKRTESGKKKIHIDRAMQARFPKDHNVVNGDDDLLDAAAIARYGEHRRRRRTRLA